MRTAWRNAGAYIALAVVIIVFAIIQPQFRQPSNLLNILDQSVEISVVAVGMTAVILTAGIDLSVGSIAALSAFLAAWVMTHEAHALGGLAGTALAGFVIALATGAAAGLCNGLAITRLRVPPFIVTLGAMSILRGLVLVASHGTGIGSRIPPFFEVTARNLISIRSSNGFETNLTMAIIVMAVIYVIGHIVLTRTAVGRSIYAIGGNEAAARLSGLPVDRILLGVYVSAGVLAAVGGIIEAATVGAAVPDAGTDLELNAIAAVVIGGTSLFGGQGSLAGTFAGALLMRTISNGLNLTNVDSNWQRVTIGGVIILAVAFDEFQKRRRLRT